MTGAKHARGGVWTGGIDGWSEGEMPRITSEEVVSRLAAYLQHELALGELVDWDAPCAWK